MDVYLERGPKKVFACALDWPGWCRSAKTPDAALEKSVRAATRMLRGATHMAVTSAAGTSLDVDLAGATTVGVWGWTDRAGTLAHWPGGLVVSFPKSAAVNGALVLDRGDINLTFKRYLEAPVRLTLEADYVTWIEGEGADAETTNRAE